MPPQENSKKVVIGSILAALVIVGVLVFLGMRGSRSTDEFEGVATTTRDGMSSVNITVTAPRPNERVGIPLIIEGEARVFENVVNYRLVAENGVELAEGFTTADALDIGQFGPFRGELMYAAETDGRGTVEVFWYSAKDGSEVDKVIIPVFYTKTPEFIKG